MNMNKALQNLYHAVSNETTTKVNISKLLVDIHYAITGKESENKNNWSKIVNSMADNWPEGGGGGGSSDFSMANVTVTVDTTSPTTNTIVLYNVLDTNIGEFKSMEINENSASYQVVIYNNLPAYLYATEEDIINSSGAIAYSSDDGGWLLSGDCAITVKIATIG